VYSAAFVRPGHKYNYLTFRVSADLNGMIYVGCLFLETIF
jgi:hypothetical protein